jgi:outer membrane protein OmpA-like peptidoglycan-associated protein
MKVEATIPHVRFKVCLSLVLLFGYAVGLAGCAAGARVRAQAEEVEAMTERIHDRAYRCAPKEIAVAESEVAFGLYELRQGQLQEARDHVFRAERYAKLAEKRSDHDVCRAQAAPASVKKTEAVDVGEGTHDRDADGIVDSKDECPSEAEDPDGFEDKDGCPDRDNDQDGVPDSSDECPNVAEGEDDGYRDADGCPDPDNDADGFVDAEEACPDTPEDFDGFKDDDGCPDRDNDDDGINDTLDECPGEAEDYDGDVDGDGCPETRQRVNVTKERIELNEKVHFASDKAEIQQRSFALLDEVATVLKANPNIQVRVEGHTDSRGSESYNMDLSQRRAEAVVEYLVETGLDASRLQAKGFGESRPIEDNATAEGRAANRRVEIHITER